MNGHQIPGCRQQLSGHILIVVVLPEPLGPRKSNSSVNDEVERPQHGLVAEHFGQRAGVDKACTRYEMPIIAFISSYLLFESGTVLFFSSSSTRL